MKKGTGVRLLSSLLAAFTLCGALLSKPNLAQAQSGPERPEVTDSMTEDTVRLIPSQFNYYEATNENGKPDRNGNYMTVDVDIASPVPRSMKESVTFRAIIPLEGGKTQILGDIGNAVDYDKFYRTPSLAEVYNTPKPPIDRRGYTLAELTRWTVWYAANRGTRVRFKCGLPPFLSPERARIAASQGYAVGPMPPPSSPKVSQSAGNFMTQINGAADRLTGAGGPNPTPNASSGPRHRTQTNDLH